MAKQDTWQIVDVDLFVTKLIKLQRLVLLGVIENILQMCLNKKSSKTSAHPTSDAPDLISIPVVDFLPTICVNLPKASRGE